MITTIAPLEAAARLTSVAERLTAASLLVHDMDVTPWSVLVHLTDERAVDIAAGLFDDTEPDAGDGATYTRVGFFDEVVTVRMYANRADFDPTDAQLKERTGPTVLEQYRTAHTESIELHS